jgi:hypothetical protein
MGWLLNQAIDKMLEAGTIHIYRDSIQPIEGIAPKTTPSIDIEELIRSYVDKAVNPLSNDLVTIQTEVGYLRDCLGKVASIDYVEKALEPLLLAITKASVTTTTAKTHNPLSPTIGTASAQEAQSQGVTPLIARVVTRLQADPNLKARVAEGCRQGLKGKDLSDWLASGGFFNSNNEPYTGASLSQFRAAIEHLNSIDND